MFENISKGRFIASGNAVHVNEHECIHVSHDEARRENAEFIAYCFNLQQRYDISKLDEAVNLFVEMIDSDLVNTYYTEKIETLLKEIKK